MFPWSIQIGNRFLQLAIARLFRTTTLFLFSLPAFHWRQVTLDPGAHATRERTVVPLSLFVTITSDVTSANNVIPLRTPSHSAHPSLSPLSGEISRPFSSPSVPSARSRCTRIRTPTRHFLLDSCRSRYNTFCNFTQAARFLIFPSDLFPQ